MGHLRSYFSLLLFLVTISDATELTSREYWKSVLPRTPMPNAISTALDSGAASVKTTTSFEQSKTDKHDPRKVGECKRALTIYHPCSPSPAQLRIDNNTETIVFIEKELYPGKRMIGHFTKSTPNAPNFIPRSEANKFPFSSFRFSDILDHFKILKSSCLAYEMKQTLNECEQPAIHGETKYCATSVESMVDFVTSSLRTHNVRAVSTNVNSPNAPKQEYTIIKSEIYANEMNELIACHKEMYVYGVFYCHQIKSTKAYMINLVGKDGDRVDAIALCHMDTSSWDPKQLAFQLLKVQPGTVPICHFFPQDNVVWIRSS